MKSKKNQDKQRIKELEARIVELESRISNFEINKLEQLINYSGEGIALIDKYGVIHETNCKVRQYFFEEKVLKKDDLHSFDFFIGKNLNQFFSSKIALAALEKIVLSINTGEIQFLDCKIPGKKNTKLFEVKFIPIDENMVAAIARDITQKKNTSDELIAMHQKNTAILNSLPDTMFHLSSKGKFLDAHVGNSDDLMVSPKEFIGKYISNVLSKEISEFTLKKIDLTLKTRQMQFYEYKLAFPDGIRTFEARMVPLGESEVISIVRNITKRLNMEGNLRQALKSESLGRLASGIAHDLNNLLTPILGYSEILMDELEQKSVFWEYAEEIASAGERARNVLTQLLAFSRKQKLEYKSIDLKKVLLDFEMLLKRTIPKNIKIKIINSADITYIWADQTLIEQVILNLTVNAAYAMPNGGYLLFKISKKEKYLQLRVIDTGCGMNSETMEKLFDPFYTTKGKEGTGLGLATVYGIINQHEGSITVKSKEGIGTTFEILLPLVKPENVINKPVLVDKEPIKGDETVLIVDDNCMVRNLAKAILTKSGYKVIETFESGDKALVYLAKTDKKINLLLSDVVMPGINGVTLYEEALKFVPGLRVLFMSGYTGEFMNESRLYNREKNFIEKPFTKKNLISKIRNILDSQKDL